MTHAVPGILASAQARFNIADLFSIDLWTGNGAARSIVNGLNLSGDGGMTWIKQRSSTQVHNIYDTARGATKYLQSSATTVETTQTQGLTSFNSDGFSLGTNSLVNGNTSTYVGWSFKKSALFFDVVVYTGNGSARTIAHNLGIAPGMIIVKRLDSTISWNVYHRSNTAAPETDYLLLNTTDGTADDTAWNDTAPTASVFSLGSNAFTNGNGNSYVAYLFAHDEASDGVIQCGSYTGNGSSTGPIVNLGWEPQYLMVKRANSTGNWCIVDNVRDSTDPRNAQLLANATNSETAGSDSVTFTATGFQILVPGSDYNSNGSTYVYMAIRKE